QVVAADPGGEVHLVAERRRAGELAIRVAALVGEQERVVRARGGLCPEGVYVDVLGHRLGGAPVALAPGLGVPAPVDEGRPLPRLRGAAGAAGGGGRAAARCAGAAGIGGGAGVARASGAGVGRAGSRVGAAELGGEEQ